MKILIIIAVVALLFLISNKTISSFTYEICDDKGECQDITINQITQPSKQTYEICNPDALKSGAKNICEQVPINRLLLKGGTNKKYCNKAPYLAGDYLDNWWNSEGLIDECEIPPQSNMQFLFKQHNQSVRSHTGTIQIKVNIINFENDYKALQILTGEDNNNDNLPDSWVHCGNVDKINGKDVKIIHCTGTNLKFIKLVNAEWNKGSLFMDSVEVLTV